MENLYNAKVSYKGEGSFTFTLPSYGELTIYEGRDLYIKGLSVAGVELLRQLRAIGVEHKLNAKSDGCYKIIDLAVYTNDPNKMIRSRLVNPVKVGSSLADLKTDLVKEPTVEEPVVEEPVVEENTKVEEPVIEEPIVKDIKPIISKKGMKKSLKKNSK